MGAATAGFGSFAATHSDSGDDSAMDFSPTMNVDGTPMMGNVDINGNPFGATSTLSSGFDEPAFNIDGTMMMGDFDTNGNPYGVTSDHSFNDSSFDSSWSSDSSWSCGSSFDSSSFDSGSSWSSDDRF